MRASVNVDSIGQGIWWVLPLLALATLCMLPGCGQGETQVSSQQAVFPVNEQGQTYGSLSDLENPVSGGVAVDECNEAYVPDLVEVTADNGVNGYVLSEDLLGPLSDLSGEATELTEDGGSTVRELPVYAQDGKTVLGSLTVSSSWRTYQEVGNEA